MVPGGSTSPGTTVTPRGSTHSTCCAGGTRLEGDHPRTQRQHRTTSDGMATNEDTVRSYEASAAEYAAEAATMPEWVAREIDAFVDALGGTGRILEIGSGGGRDAREL